MLRVSRFIDTGMQWIGIFAYWLIPPMVLVGVWNVFGRFFGQAIGTNLTNNGLIETQWYLFAITFFLGAPYALLHNEHVRVDVVYTRMSGRRRAWINLLGAILFLIPFASLIIYFSWNFIGTSWSGWETSPDPSGLPRYPIKTLIAVGMGLLIIQGISEVIKNIARLRGAYPLDHGAESHAALAATPQTDVETDAIAATAAPAPTVPDDAAPDAAAPDDTAPEASQNAAPEEPPPASTEPREER